MSDREPSPSAEVSAARTLAGGFLMGLANLVPGVSGGTMILALGLYDRFISAVAELTTLRWSPRLFRFLTLLAIGLAVSILGLAGIAVELVTEKRWIMYSLFIGMTLGGVPELLRLTRPFRAGECLSVAAGVAAMAALAWGLSATQVPQNLVSFFLIGALAASSMILPGVSGSYILLIFGMYATVIGSLSSSALREDPVASAKIIVPVVVGAGVGIALLSNLLKWLLAAYRGPSHGALLGLLCGSVLGLFPFQEPVHPELARKETRKAVQMLVVDGATPEEVSEARGYEWEEGEASALATKYADRDANELKTMSEELRYFRASGGQWGIALGLLAAGFLLTQLLGTREKRAE